MPIKRITAEAFQMLAKESKGLDDNTIVIKADVGLIKAIDDSRRCTFKVSSGAVDRDRDVINQAGWRLDNYLKNPVVLWGHQYGMPPIATCKSLGLQGGDLLADADFFDEKTYPFADTIYKIVKAGGLRASSVGFKPLKYNYNAERGGVDIEEAELLEWSVVSVPANPEALVQLAATLEDGDAILKSFINGCEQMLDSYYGCTGVWVPREQVEKAFDVINKSGLIAPNPVQVTVPTVIKTATDGVKCGESDVMTLELADPIEPVYLELSDVFLDIDTDIKMVNEIILRVVKEGVSGLAKDAAQQVSEAIDYARGRVR